MYKQMLYKNLASLDRKRRVFSSCVVNKGQLYNAFTERKYIYLIRRVGEQNPDDLKTHVFIRNERKDFEHNRRFSCILKGGFYVNSAEGLFFIRYAHSLTIRLQDLRENPA